MTRLRLLNGRFDALTTEETLDRAAELVRTGERGHLCTVNVAMLMMMRSDARLQSFVDAAAISVADGQPLVWYSRLKKNRLPERVTGVDLVERLCADSVRHGWGVYFLGARDAVVRETARRMTERHPGLTVSGLADGYFGPEEASKRALRIRESGARILIVGMGVPRQENFLQDHWEQLGVNLAVPVGGSFEVLAGRKKRAPAMIQRIGLEWMFRLCQEPGRLWKRYLTTNTRFLFLVIGEILTSGRGSGRVAPQNASGRQDPAKEGGQEERRAE
jgi:N-acetylglucosaminyldiphosphoundecaprenol N-acetyl-beta-D-mannosaminyltransferase